MSGVLKKFASAMLTITFNQQNCNKLQDRNAEQCVGATLTVSLCCLLSEHCSSSCRPGHGGRRTRSSASRGFSRSSSPSRRSTSSATGSWVTCPESTIAGESGTSPGPYRYVTCVPPCPDARLALGHCPSDKDNLFKDMKHKPKHFRSDE